MTFEDFKRWLPVALALLMLGALVSHLSRNPGDLLAIPWLVVAAGVVWYLVRRPPQTKEESDEPDSDHTD